MTVGLRLPLDDATGPPRGRGLVARLLEARAATSAAGNRRTLFARLDALLAGETGADDVDALRAEERSADGPVVELRRIRLRNWKSFERADLAVPPSAAGRRLTVVDGRNGFGKSSLLEAYAFCLFGRRAVTEMGFLISGTGGRAGQRRSYREALERRLHRSERAVAEGVCAISLDFETADGPVAVERKWYFDEAGRAMEEDEELVVRVGDDRHLLEAPAGERAREWYQGEIERRIMPVGLAPFFIFDGEQVERWAERKLSDQIRSAIARVLGLDDVRGLAADLHVYARDRERAGGDPDGSDTAELAERVRVSGRELEGLRGALASTDAALTEERARRAEALSTLSSLAYASHADVHALLEGRHRLAAELERVRRELAAAVVDHAPLLLAGGTLTSAVSGRLADGVASAVALEPGEVADLWSRFAALDPPLDPQSSADLRERFEQALAGPGTDGGRASGGRLDRAGRRSAVQRLDRVADEGRRAIEVELEAVDRVRAELSRLVAAEEADARDVGMRTAAQAVLEKVGARIEELERERGSREAAMDSLRTALEPDRAELERRTAHGLDAGPRLGAAAAARRIALALDDRLAQLSAGEHARFAAAVSASYRALAHKGQVERFEISPEGEITLIDRSGRDVTDYRLSAGESQLFAMALISAVGSLLGDRLPVVADTPLGRLDDRHRGSVLAMLATRGAQTILLTQPEEMTERQVPVVAASLAGWVRLEHAVDVESGVGVSRFAEGAPPRSAIPAEAA